MVASANELPPSQDNEAYEEYSWLRFNHPLDKSELKQISSLLGQMGLSYSYIEDQTPNTYNPDSQIDRINRYGFRFTDITSEDDYVFREHFDYLAETNPSLSHRNFSRLFNHLVDGAEDTNLTTFNHTDRQHGRFVQQRPVAPLPGIQLINRTEYGLGKYTSSTELQPHARIIANYGIKAGTILDVALHYGELSMKKNIEHSKQNQSLSILIKKLSGSIET